jgi:hypothetical protein
VRAKSRSTGSSRSQAESFASQNAALSALNTLYRVRTKDPILTWKERRNMTEKAMTDTNTAKENQRRSLFGRITYITIALLLMCTAGFFRLRLPQEPLIDSDVQAFLGPALTLLTDQGFQHSAGVSFVYPLFAYLILGVFGKFRAITIVQHLLGLAAGGILLACWNRSLSFIKKPVTSTPICRLLGLLVAALFLFNTSVIRLEHAIRPDAIFPFFAALSMFFNIQFIRYRFLQREDWPALVYGTITVFNACLLFFLKPNFYLATAFATLPIWIYLLDPKESLRKKLRLIGLAAISSAMLFLPEEALKRTDPSSKTFLPATLFVMHANIIRDQLALDLESKTKNPYPPEFLEKTYILLSQEITLSKQTGRYTSLGFDPSYLMAEDSFDRKFSNDFEPGGSDSSRVKFYYYYFFRTWTHQPTRMLRKVLQQLGILYNNIRKASPYKLEDHKQFSVAYSDNCKLFNTRTSFFKIEYEPMREFIINSTHLTNTGFQLTQPRAVTWTNRFLSRTFTLSILLALVFAFIIAKNADLRENYGWFLGTILFFYTYSFANSLGIGIIHTLETQRYLTNQLVFCLLPQCLTFFLAIELHCSWRQRCSPLRKSTDG